MITAVREGRRASDNWRPKWQCIRKRQWEPIRDSWISHVPIFHAIAERPNPGLDDFAPLLAIEIESDCARHADVPGLRKSILWEAIFLFHKCSHTSLAAQRLAISGMHSWCQFNAYHSAFIGAKGIMSMLGVAFPSLGGKQVAIDIFPEPNEKYKKRVRSYQDFLAFGLPRLEQRRVWEGFIRVLNISEAECWDPSLYKNLLKLKYDDITPPRNRFLYKANYWPMDDLVSDSETSANYILAHDLDVADEGFLLNLSCTVYRLFEDLMKDLAKYSPLIQAQLEGSRCVSITNSDLMLYKEFLSMRSLQ